MHHAQGCYTIPFMIRWLIRCLGALLLSAALMLPAVAQDAKSKSGPTGAKTTQPASTGDGHPAPVAQYAVALIIVLVILTVVCMPSRKR